MSSLVLFFLFPVCLLAQSIGALAEAEQAFRVGDVARAADLASKVLAANPASGRVHLVLGIIAAHRRQWPQAQYHFTTAIHLEPANPYGYFYLGQAFLYQQQWKQAAQHFESAAERNYPDHARLVVELALAQNKAGDAQKALATLRSVAPTAGGPLAAQYHAVSAFAYESLHQPDRAIEAVRRARELDPANREYWDFLVSKLIQANRISQAVAEAVQAQKKFPDHAEAHFLLGVSSSRLANVHLTKLALRNLVEAEPESPRSLFLQGLVFRQQGHRDRAMAAFAEAARRGVRESHLLLGLVLKEAGDLDSAERELRTAVRLNPENGQTQFELAKLLLAREQEPEALNRLQNAARLMPLSAVVHYHLAALYRKLGEKEKAEQHLQKFEQLKKELDVALTREPQMPDRK